MNPVVKHLIKDKIAEMATQAGMKDHGDLGEGWVSNDPECEYPECVYTESLLKFAGVVADFIVLRYPFQMNNRIRIMLDAAYESGFKHGVESRSNQ